MKNIGISIVLVCMLSIGCESSTNNKMDESLNYALELDTILPAIDGKDSWFQPSPVAIPRTHDNEVPLVVMTIQRVMGSDFFSGINVMRSEDLGKTWTEPFALPQLGWRSGPEGLNMGVCDFTWVWHPQTGKALGIGHTALYTDAGFAGFGNRRDIAYIIYDPKSDSWSPWKLFDFPKTDNDKYFFNGVHGQFLVESDGNILVPVYFVPPNMGFQLTGMVMRCAFDGDKLIYVEHGREMDHAVQRGLYEKSITYYGGKYYMTIRNDEKGFVTVSTDGLNYDPIRPWTFDDNQDLGSYNTQQKWVTHSDGLFLVYTRRGADNDHIIRHRAPLFIAEIDTATLQVIRATERIIVPERGASLGNFAATRITEHETWVTVAGVGGPAYKASITWSKENIIP